MLQSHFEKSYGVHNYSRQKLDQINKVLYWKND